MIRLIVCGASGRMGQRILDLARRNPEFKIVAAIESGLHGSVGRKILDDSIQVSDNLSSFKDQADAVIDFTLPKATLSNIKTLQGWKGVSLVIGTTGFSKMELAEIEKAAKKFPILLSPNMSVGVNLLFDLVRAAAAKLPNYDIEILETHHNQKKDAPSGTALGLAREITDEIGRSMERDLVYGRKGEPGARQPKEIGIHAIRAGDTVGDHTVIFATQGERVELSHRATSRDAFASGALRAAQWLKGKKPGLYSMKDVLSQR